MLGSRFGRRSNTTLNTAVASRCATQTNKEREDFDAALHDWSKGPQRIKSYFHRHRR